MGFHRVVELLSPDSRLYPITGLSTWFTKLPILYCIGDLELITFPLTGLFCSRKCPGDAILKAYDIARELRDKEKPVISGFHSLVEKDMLDILLRGNGSIVVCPARGLEGMLIPVKFRKKITEGKLLICSIAGPLEKRMTAEIAEERNKLVAALATEHKFIFIEKGGKLEKLIEKVKIL